MQDGLMAKDADTTGLTSAQIDALFSTTPVAGQTIIDSAQNRFLVRKNNGKWAYVAITQIT
jgi:hypothetical protein